MKELSSLRVINLILTQFSAGEINLLNYVHYCHAAFFLSGNRVMQAFKDDPIRTLSFLINMEKRPDGLEMAQLVHDRYLDKQQNYENQMEQIEQVVSC